MKKSTNTKIILNNNRLLSSQLNQTHSINNILQLFHSRLKKQRPTTTSRPVGRENAPTNETKKIIELHQTSTKNTQKDQRQTRPSVQPNTQLAGKITVMEPRAYSEAMTIAKRIIAGEATLVNFRLVEEKQARRIVDFLTGTVYALDGDIKRVGDEIFLCTPAGLEIDSSTAQSFADGSMFDL